MDEFANEEILQADWDKALDAAKEIDKPLEHLANVIEELTTAANELYGTFEFDRIISMIDDVEEIRIELSLTQKRLRSGGK